MSYSSIAGSAVSCILILACVSTESRAQAPHALVQLNADLKELTAKASPAVVQIVASGYRPMGVDNSSQTPVFARQQGIGSGVILDPSGYIITNAHVVNGADRVEVILTKRNSNSGGGLTASDESILPATVLGVTDYFDLALLKVDATGLPTLAFADFQDVTQGQIVIAIGSPLGLDNSVTMGIISSVGRQARPDSPVVYVQTDAPINPGNSGGALVDVNGRLVGINTFILSQAGGNEGLGFALPAPVVSLAYRSLRQKGHVDRRTMGIGIQAITPTLAKGLGLPRIYGLLVCDVLPGGPGEKAGLKIGDIIIEAESRPISTPPQLDGSIYTHDIDQPLSLTIQRGVSKVPVRVQLLEVPHQLDSAIDQTDPTKNFMRPLGVIAATITADMVELAGNLRIKSGVIVVARTADPAPIVLSTGDVIHSVNNIPIEDIDTLRNVFAKFKHGDPVVLQVERQGGLEFDSFELE
jgi:serine protease Do